MRQMPDIEKNVSKEKIQWYENTCVNFKTDTDKLNFVVYRYRNELYLKDNEVGLNLSEYQLLLAKRVYFLSYIDIL